MAPFMKDPTEVYRAWLRAHESEAGFEEGRMAMALEIITVRASLKAVGMLSTELVSVIETFLVDQDLLEEAEALYAELSDWRRTKFVADVSDVSEPEAPRRAGPPSLGTPSWLRRGRDRPPSDEPEE